MGSAVEAGRLGQPLPPATTTNSQHPTAVKATIWEGEGVVYLLRANRILTEDLQVPVSVSTDGDFGADSGVRRVGIRRGTNRTYHQFQTTDDDTDEANGSITAMALRSGVGYKIAAAGNQATVRVVDNDPGPAMTYTTIRIATAAAVITEGADAVFTITADPPPPFDLPVHLRISSQGNYGVSGRGMQLTILADETELTHTVRTTGARWTNRTAR